ncbi:hypothetical protein Vretimale_5690 [Volvox reticuliferus]|uniref:Uncharacterized protein n=1 Tax=Volvox reticuliferus TaxID=1737510 RepID=A0A8J4G645_9CHLO|nr:hypothetical protein Vretimale_5690 [Volvox reticuliferus]
MTMANTFNVLESMRLRTQLTAPGRENYGVPFLSSSELERVQNPLQLTSHSSRISANTLMPGAPTSKACGGGESCPTTTDANSRLTAVPTAVKVMTTDQSNCAVSQQRFTCAPIISPSYVEGRALDHKCSGNLRPPASDTQSGAVAPAPALARTAQGWPSSSGSDVSTPAGDRRSPLGSTAASRGWCVGSSGPTHLATSIQGDAQRAPVSGAAAAGPHGQKNSSPTGIGSFSAEALLSGPLLGSRSHEGVSSLDSCHVGHMHPLSSLLQPQQSQLQQQQQCPHQQEHRIVTQDRAVTTNQQLRHQQLYAQQQQLIQSMQPEQLMGGCDWQKHQLQMHAQALGVQSTRESVLPQGQQPEGLGTLQLHQVQSVQQFSGQVQMQGHQVNGVLQGRLDAQVTTHRLMGAQAQMAPYSQPQRPNTEHGVQLQTMQPYQQQNTTTLQPVSGGDQVITVHESQQKPRPSMMSPLISTLGQPPAVQVHQPPATVSSPMPQPQQQPTQQRDFSSSNTELQSQGVWGAQPTASECVNRTSGNPAPTIACQQHPSMCPGRQQIGSHMQATVQDLQMLAGPQPYPAQQQVMQGSQPQADSQASLMRSGPHMMPTQQGRQVQPGEPATRAQVGSQGPEANGRAQYRYESLLCQQPQHQQQEQAHSMPNMLAHKQEQAEDCGYGRLWAQREQLGIAQKKMHLDHNQQSESSHLLSQISDVRASQQLLLQQRQQSQILQQQQQRRQEQQAQEEQCQPQQLSMLDLLAQPRWQQAQLQSQAQIQPGTAVTWTTRYQQSGPVAGDDLVAQRQQLPGAEHILQQLNGQRVQSGQCNQGYVGSSLIEAGPPKRRTEPGHNAMLYHAQEQQLLQQQLQQRMQWHAEVRGKQEPTVQQPQCAQHQRQYQQAPADKDGSSLSFVAAGQEQHLVSASSNSLQAASSLGVSRGRPDAEAMQHGLLGFNSSAKAQAMMQPEPCLAAVPQRSSIVTSSSGAPQSLLPSAPSITLPMGSSVAVSSGNPTLQLMHQQEAQQSCIAAMTSSQPILQPAAFQHQNDNSTLVSGGLLRAGEFSAGAADPQSGLRPQRLQQLLLRKQQDAANVTTGSHNAQHVLQCRYQAEVRTHAPIPDSQPQQQHQLSGQDSCATPDGAGQEEVEAVARAGSNPRPHAALPLSMSVPANIRAGAAPLPHGAETMQQPPQQQRTQSRVGFHYATYTQGQQQQGPFQQEQQPQLPHGPMPRQYNDPWEQGVQDFSLQHGLISDMQYHRSGQAGVQHQVRVDKLQQGEGQQQPKPGQLSLASRMTSQPTELLQGRPLLPLFKPPQDKESRTSLPWSVQSLQQWQHERQLLPLNEMVGSASSTAVAAADMSRQERLMDVGSAADISKAAAATHETVVQAQHAQRLHEETQFKLLQQHLQQQRPQQQLEQAELQQLQCQQQQQQQQQLLLQRQQQQQQQKLQQLFVRPALQLNAASTIPKEVRASGPAGATNGLFHTCVNPQAQDIQAPGQLVSQEQQLFKLQQQQQQWQLLQQQQLMHQQDSQPPQQCQQQGNQPLSQCTGQEPSSWRAMGSSQWLFKDMGPSCRGVGNAMPAANATVEAGAQTATGTVRPLLLEQVNAEVLHRGRSSAEQGPPNVQLLQQQALMQEPRQEPQQQVIRGQEHMAPRPQSRCSDRLQLQQQQLSPPQQQHWLQPNYHLQQQAQQHQSHQQLQAATSFDHGSWTSGTYAAPGPACALASDVVGGPALNQMVSGQSSTHVMTPIHTSSAAPAMNGVASQMAPPWVGYNATGGGQGSCGSSVPGLEPPYKRTKLEDANCAATLQPPPTGPAPLSDDSKAAMTAAMEAANRLIGPMPVLRRPSGDWAPPLGFCHGAGYESSTETKPGSVRTAGTPQAAYGHPQLTLLDQHHYLHQQQLLTQRQRQQIHLGSTKSQDDHGEGQVVAAVSSMLPSLTSPSPAHLSSPQLPVSGAPVAPVVLQNFQLGLDDSFSVAPSPAVTGAMLTAPPPRRRPPQAMSQKAVATVQPPPPAEGCARSRPIDRSKLGQHRLKPPPVIHPLRLGSRRPLGPARLCSSAIGLLGNASHIAPLVPSGALTEDTAAGGSMVPDGNAAPAGGNSSKKRLAVKDRKVPVELVPVVGKAVGAGASGVRIKHGKGGSHGSGPAAATAPGKLLNALREAKALLNRRFVVRRSGIAQLGVFAAERIPVDTLLMEYHGEAVRNTVADLREKSRGLGLLLVQSRRAS